MGRRTASPRTVDATIKIELIKSVLTTNSHEIELHDETF